MRARLLVASVSLGLALTCGIALAGVKGSVFAQESASGEYAIATAAGNVGHPRAIYVKVISHPRQRVRGAWLVTCAKGFGAGSKQGQVGGMTTLTQKLKMPYARPSSCTVSANAQLSRGGRVKVKLYAQH